MLVQLIYFLYYGGLGAVGNYLPLFFVEQQHFSLQQVGSLGLVRQLSTLVGATFWCGLADRRRAHQTVLLLAGVGFVAVQLGLYFADAFVLAAGITLAAQFLSSGVGPLIDHGALAVLGSPDDWGRFRLWGALGFGLASFGMGYAVPRYGFPVIFLSNAALCLGGVLLARCRLPFDGDSKKDIAAGGGAGDGSGRRAESLRDFVHKGVGILTHSTDHSIFFAVVLLNGCAAGIIDNFLFLYLQNELGAPKRLLGLGRLITCLAEIPWFWFAAALMERFTVFQILQFTELCYLVRFSWYLTLRDPWNVVYAEPLHGITYAINWSACTSYGHRMAPKGMEATMLGVLNAVYWGLGQSSGALLGGFAYQHYSGSFMFKAAIAVAGTALTILLGRTYFLAHRPPGLPHHPATKPASANKARGLPA